jgi:hypothetical protein
MKRIAALTIAALVVLATAVPALAGTTGYEGQPGNQSSGGGGGNSGYEGQPGNQSH